MLDRFAGFDRAAGIGGSDAAAALGLSPYRSALDVWREKTRDPSWRPQFVTGAMEWGTRLEPALRDKYKDLTGRTVRIDPYPADPFIRTQEHDGTLAYWHPNGIQFAHLDGWVHEWAIFEGKVASDPTEWADGVPVWYVVQIQQYMDIVGAPSCIVAVLLGGNDYRTFDVPADHEYQRWIREGVERFWSHNVEDRIPPEEYEPPVPADPGLPVVVGHHLDTVVSELLATRHNLAQVSEHEQYLVDRLKDEIGPAPGMVGSGWHIDYKESRPAKKVAWEHVAAGLENTLEAVRRFRERMPPEVQPHLDPRVYDMLVSLYTTQSRAARPFVLKEDE